MMTNTIEPRAKNLRYIQRPRLTDMNPLLRAVDVDVVDGKTLFVNKSMLQLFTAAGLQTSR